MDIFAFIIKLILISMRGILHASSLINLMYHIDLNYFMWPVEFPYMDWIYDDMLISAWLTDLFREFEDTSKLISLTKLFIWLVKLYGYYYF